MKTFTGLPKFCEYCEDKKIYVSIHNYLLYLIIYTCIFTFFTYVCCNIFFNCLLVRDRVEFSRNGSVVR